jgi:hypothetical protein
MLGDVAREFLARRVSKEVSYRGKRGGATSSRHSRRFTCLANSGVPAATGTEDGPAWL